MSDLHNPEHDAGFRPAHRPGSFLDKRDQRPTLTSHECSTAGKCRTTTCGTAYPCSVRGGESA